jgi:tryptophan-rich sensory protein
MKKSSLLVRIILSVLLCLIVGFASSFFTIDAIPNWYANIHKPTFNPPNWLFGPVWTLLYILMGIAAALVWHGVKKNKKVNAALILFLVQLILNACWTMIFFGFHRPLYAFIEIGVLWILILICIILFYLISRPAAYMMIPYLFWVSFAAVLNMAIVALN